MHNLTAADSTILLIYLFFVIGIGISLRSAIKSRLDFFLAGRVLPAWICALAFVGVSLGGPELIGTSAMGAKYGLAAAQFYGIGSVPAMLFLGLYMMPVYRVSGARSVPDYLGIRFDAKTRLLSACLFLAMTTFCAGMSLCILVRIFQTLHFFDEFFPRLAASPQAVFAVTAMLASVVVLAYIVPGGLAATMYNQVIQFCLVMAALLPIVFLGLKNIGGWSGLKAALAPEYFHEWAGPSNAMGTGVTAMIAGLGFVLGFSYWCTDFVVLQTAFAACDVRAARRVPLFAAMPRMVLPFLLIVPGMIAIALPTPHTSTTVTTTPGGAIVHNIQVVSIEVEQGKGIIPARLDSKSQKPLSDGGKGTLLDFSAVIPGMFLHYFPTGMLGFGLTALIAACMSSVAGSITAFTNVLTCDLYQPCIRKQGDDPHVLLVGRIVAGIAAALSIALAYALAGLNDFIVLPLLVLSIVNAPLLATILLGMFSRRTTSHGAFVGLFTGTVAAILHHGLTLPEAIQPGVCGGWLRTVHHYPDEMAQALWGAIFAFLTSFVVTVIVSLATKPRQDSELKGLVRTSLDQPLLSVVWWKRPEALATAILAGAIALNIFFA